MGVARGSGETACSQHKRGGEIETSDVGVRTEVFSAAISKSKSVDFATPGNVGTQARLDRRRALRPLGRKSDAGGDWQVEGAWTKARHRDCTDHMDPAV